MRSFICSAAVVLLIVPALIFHALAEVAEAD
jgi:hypothetical protein